MPLYFSSILWTFLYFKSIEEKEMNALMDFVKNDKNAIHLIKQISPWDVELEIMCNNYEEYNVLLNNITEKFHNIIHKVETAIMGEDYVFPSNKMVFE